MITKEEVCCEQMFKHVMSFLNKNTSVDGELDTCIWYEEKERQYHVLCSNLLKHYTGYPISFCPWCGSKLPEPLDPDETIEKEYGADYLRPYYDPMYRPLPEDVDKDFQSDAWWKKRGL